MTLVIKNLPASAGDVRDASSTAGLGRSPGEGNGNLLQCSCLENPHGQRRLPGYSLWGFKGSDTSEWHFDDSYRQQHLEFTEVTWTFLCSWKSLWDEKQSVYWEIPLALPRVPTGTALMFSSRNNRRSGCWESSDTWGLERYTQCTISRRIWHLYEVYSICILNMLRLQILLVSVDIWPFILLHFFHWTSNILKNRYLFLTLFTVRNKALCIFIK